MAGKITCPGFLFTDVDGYPYCEDGTGAPLAWTEIPEFTTADIDLDEAAGFFAAGFVMIGTAWAIGFGIRQLLDIIRR